MKVGNQHYRSIWFDEQSQQVKIIDQRWLPHRFLIVELNNLDAFIAAIGDMWVRGAPLIGATAAYAFYVQMKEDPSNQSLDQTYDLLLATRPTAVNLRWALDDMRQLLAPLTEKQRCQAAFVRAQQICESDVEIGRAHV